MMGMVSRVRSSIRRTAGLLLAIAIAVSMPVSTTGACVMTLLGDAASTAACGQVCTMAQCPMQGQRMPEGPARTNDPRCCQMSSTNSTPAVPLRPVTTVRTLPEHVAVIVPPTIACAIETASASFLSRDSALDPRPPRTA